MNTISELNRIYDLKTYNEEFQFMLSKLISIFPELERKKYSLVFVQERALGKCKKNFKDDYTIYLNQIFACYAPKEDREQTIAHEILHSLDGCYNHGTNWKYACSLVNSRLKMNITTKHSIENLDEYYKNNPSFKYEIVCPHCGVLSRYMRKSGCVKSLEEGRKNYHCTKCQSRDLTVNYL